MAVNENTPRNKGFRARVRRCVDSNTASLLVIILVLLDCVIIIAELVIDLQCESMENFPTAHLVTFYMSRIILVIFIIELLIRLYAHGMEFFTIWMDVCDAIVITVTVVLDVIDPLPEEWSTSVNFIIVIRLWRIISVIYAILASATTHTEYLLEKEIETRKAAEQTLVEFRAYSDYLEIRNAQIRSLLIRREIQDPTNPVNSSTRPKSTYIFRADVAKKKKLRDRYRSQTRKK